jgi:hypothetical protein
MPHFTHILFDLDGTLTDPRQGIGNSLKYALRQMQIDGYSDEILERFVGPPLQDGFRNQFGMNDRQVALAVDHFRTYFGEKGLFENVPYPGISELLEELHFAGKKVYLVTSKLEKYARRVDWCRTHRETLSKGSAYCPTAGTGANFRITVHRHGWRHSLRSGWRERKQHFRHCRHVRFWHCGIACSLQSALFG